MRRKGRAQQLTPEEPVEAKLSPADQKALERIVWTQPHSRHRGVGRELAMSRREIYLAAQRKRREQLDPGSVGRSLLPETKGKYTQLLDELEAKVLNGDRLTDDDKGRIHELAMLRLMRGRRVTGVAHAARALAPKPPPKADSAKSPDPRPAKPKEEPPPPPPVSLP
jgi:hypothetical protein